MPRLRALALSVLLLARARAADDEYSYASKDIETRPEAVHACSTASVDTSRLKAWDDKFEIIFKFPEWKEGLEVMVDLGGGVTGLDQCWNAERGSAKTIADANGRLVLAFSLGMLDPNNAEVGCLLRGFYSGAASISYDGADCDPPPPPAPPDLRYWTRCEYSRQFGVSMAQRHGFEYHVLRCAHTPTPRCGTSHRTHTARAQIPSRAPPPTHGRRALSRRSRTCPLGTPLGPLSRYSRAHTGTTPIGPGCPCARLTCSCTLRSG